jgi:hypothetical protein
MRLWGLILILILSIGCASMVEDSISTQKTAINNEEGTTEPPYLFHTIPITGDMEFKKEVSRELDYLAMYSPIWYERATKCVKEVQPGKRTAIYYGVMSLPNKSTGSFFTSGETSKLISTQAWPHETQHCIDRRVYGIFSGNTKLSWLELETRALIAGYAYAEEMRNKTGLDPFRGMAQKTAYDVAFSYFSNERKNNPDFDEKFKDEIEILEAKYFDKTNEKPKTEFIDETWQMFMSCCQLGKETPIISDFEECAEYYPVRESNPMWCVDPVAGRIYTQEIDTTEVESD